MRKFKSTDSSNGKCDSCSTGGDYSGNILSGSNGDSSICNGSISKMVYGFNRRDFKYYYTDTIYYSNRND